MCWSFAREWTLCKDTRKADYSSISQCKKFLYDSGVQEGELCIYRVEPSIRKTLGSKYIEDGEIDCIRVCIITIGPPIKRIKDHQQQHNGMNKVRKKFGL